MTLELVPVGPVVGSLEGVIGVDLGELEVPAGVVAQIMGHKPSATAEKHYRVRPLDLLRMWHTKIEAWILEQAGIEQPSEGVKPGLRAVTAA